MHGNAYKGAGREVGVEISQHMSAQRSAGEQPKDVDGKTEIQQSN